MFIMKLNMAAEAQHPTKHSEFKHPKEPFQKALQYWKEFARDPSDTLVPNNIQYGTAFGNGAILLGQDNELTAEVKKKLVDGKTTIAGIEFTGEELSWIGQYYEGINVKNKLKGRCMDERIDETTGTSGIHVECGAAAATGAVIGKTGVEVEDMAVRLTGENHKTGLIDGIGHHEALTVMVTLGSQPYSLNTNKYNEAREHAALPFHTFIDLQEIDSFAQAHKVDRVAVFKALLKWNPQIAFNIMQGNHNHYSTIAKTEGMIALLDYRGVDNNQFTDMLQAADEFFTSQKAKITRVEIDK